MANSCLFSCQGISCLALLPSLQRALVQDITHFCPLCCLRSPSSLLAMASALTSTLLSLTRRSFHNLTPIFFPSLTCALVSRAPWIGMKSTPSGFPLGSCLQIFAPCYVPCLPCFSFLGPQVFEEEQESKSSPASQTDLICTLMESYRFVS